MRCQECGAEIMEGLDFCPKCDTPVTPPPPPEKKNLFSIICAISLVLALIAGAVFLIICISGDYRSQDEIDESITTDLAKYYVKCSFSGELDKILGIMPKKLVETAADEAHMTVRKMKEYLAEVGKSQIAEIDWQYGDDWEYHFVYAPKTELPFGALPPYNPMQNSEASTRKIFNSKKITGKAFDDLKEQYATIGLELQDARKVITYVEVSSPWVPSAGPQKITVITVKIDGTWYLGAMAE